MARNRIRHSAQKVFFKNKWKRCFYCKGIEHGSQSSRYDVDDCFIV